MAKEVYKKLTAEEKQAQVYSQVAENIITVMEREEIPWHKPWRPSDNPIHNAKTGKAYQGGNVLVTAIYMMANNYNDPRFIAYNQALEMTKHQKKKNKNGYLRYFCEADCKLGGHVRKGETGCRITVYKPIDRKDEEQEDGSVVSRAKFYLSTATIFNVEQIDSLELPTLKTPTLKPNQAIEQAEQIVANMTNKPPIQHGGDRAFYTPALDAIKLPSIEQHDGSEEYYATLFHELVHSTGHKSRLGRHAEGVGDLHSGGFGSKGYAAEELVAEFGSAFLRADAGIIQGSIENSAAYIASWLKVIKTTPGIVQTAATAAVKAADYITGKRG